MGIHMLALAEELTAASIDVTVAYWPAPATEAMMSRAPRLGVRIARTPHPRDPAYSAALTSLVRSLAPDVFHVHVGTGRENFGGARAARAAGVAAVVETLHMPWMMRSPRKREAFFASLDAVDRLIVVSEAQRATYERIGVPTTQMRTVPNGVVPRKTGYGRDAARRLLGLNRHRPVLMTVGRLAVQKGHRHLIDALPRLLETWPDLVAIVAGDGHLRDALEDHAARLGVGHALHLIGHRTEVRALLDAADVFVLPSRQEGMPMAALEAMDAALPVVATHVTGTSEVVDHGVTGWLVQPGDPRQIADAIATLLSDDALRRRFGDAGRRLYRERFTAERMTAETLAVYAETLGRTACSIGPTSLGAAR
ncbi:glycosyltransferase family 4 protein [uncultured Aeromicrobium sp.]|uniref:glycosyltransferase family 4 protein n=1 Tax=uncultured Aeromicrobium sp. TaxID=337820 RepID=UPI0025FE3B35|nr:glycosyltransferase family 4 protein [uncultured Aeromicrobium sp.]